MMFAKECLCLYKICAFFVFPPVASTRRIADPAPGRPPDQSRCPSQGIQGVERRRVRLSRATKLQIVVDKTYLSSSTVGHDAPERSRKIKVYVALIVMLCLQSLFRELILAF